jgi:hypothetical protein
MTSTEKSNSEELAKTIRDHLKHNLDIVESRLSHFDDLRLRTRHMCILIWAALTVYSYNANLPILHALGIIITLLLSGIEQKYHKYHHGWEDSDKEIREDLRSVLLEADGDKLKTIIKKLYTYCKEGESRARYLKNTFWPFYALLAFISLCAMVLTFLSK